MMTTSLAGGSGWPGSLCHALKPLTPRPVSPSEQGFSLRFSVQPCPQSPTWCLVCSCLSASWFSRIRLRNVTPLLHQEVVSATPVCARLYMHTCVYLSMWTCVLTCPVVLDLILGYMKCSLCVCSNIGPVHVCLSPHRMALMCVFPWAPNIHSCQRTPLTVARAAWVSEYRPG